MTVIHAHRRTKTYTHTFPDVTLVFNPNVKGDVVCDVESESAVDRLLETPTGFRLYFEREEDKLSPLLDGYEAGEVALMPPVADTEPVVEMAADTIEPAPQVALMPPVPEVSPYVLVAEGVEPFDLRPLSDEQLRAFADANGITVHPKAKGDKIRNRIVAALKSEG